MYEVIIGEEYSQKNAWVYAYYHELPLELITEKHLHGLYDFLKDTSDRDITSSSMLIRNCQYSTLSVPYLGETLLLAKQNEQKLLERQDIWIR